MAEKLGDPSHRRYTYDYDDNRNMTRMVDVRPGGDRATWLGYDPNDRLLTVDERWGTGKDTELRYDEDGLIQQRRTDGDFDDEDGTYGGGTRTRFTYDSRGAEQTAIVTRAGERARTILTDWFPSGQRARRIRCNGELDPAEHPNAECGDEGTDTELRATDRYFYRSDGRLIRKVRDPRSGPSDTQEYAYDDNGNRNRDERGTHTFNARNQLTSWTKSGRGTVRYEVNGTGAVTPRPTAGSSRGTTSSATAWSGRRRPRTGRPRRSTTATPTSATSSGSRRSPTRATTPPVPRTRRTRTTSSSG